MEKIIFIILASILISNNKNANKYKSEIEKVKTFVNYNKDYAILIDYSIPNYKNRMFLINLNSKKIIKSFKVANGKSNNLYTLNKKDFSNKVGSNKSSYGVSVVSERGYSNWGIRVKYILEGLEKTNTNIKKRNIVLHSYSGIKENIQPIVKSQGCPTVSNDTMEYLDKFFNKNKKILIYTFSNEKK